MAETKSINLQQAFHNVYEWNRKPKNHVIAMQGKRLFWIENPGNILQKILLLVKSIFLGFRLNPAKAKSLYERSLAYATAPKVVETILALKSFDPAKGEGEPIFVKRSELKKSLAQRNHDLESEINGWKELCNNALIDEVRLRGESGSLIEAHNQQMADARRELDEVRAQLRASQDEKAAPVGNLERQSQAAEESANLIEHLKDEKESCLNALQKGEENLRDLIQEKAVLESEIITLNQMKEETEAELNEKLAKLSNDNKDLKELLHKIKKEHRQIQEEFNNLLDIVEKERNESLLARKDSANEITTLKNQITELQNMNSKWEPDQLEIIKGSLLAAAEHKDTYKPASKEDENFKEYKSAVYF